MQKALRDKVMKRKFLLIAAIAMGVASFPAAMFFLKASRPATFKTAGVIEGMEVNVSSTVPGRILKKFSGEGDPVTSGQVLIELESDELSALKEQASANVEKVKADMQVFASAIENAKANMEAAEADIQGAAAGLEKARVDMEEKKRELDRYEALFRKQLAARATYDAVLAAYEGAEADYRSAKARLVSIQAKRTAANAQLKTAESQLNASMADLAVAEANRSVYAARLAQTIITSPISGVVVFNAMEPGEWVNPGFTILTIVDMENLYAKIAVEETLVDRISLNQTAAIHTDNSPGKAFRGKISEIGRYAEFATQRDVTRGWQDIRTFKVKVKVEDPGRHLKPGMTVEVEIPLQGAQ